MCQKIIKFGEDLTKFCQKQIWEFFWPTLYTTVYNSIQLIDWLLLQVAKYAKTTSETSGGRRALGSTVGAVLQHDDDDEEEYDPRRPAIGNVASVVKVTERR